MAGRLILGAPGLYNMPDAPVRALTSARMDVCAFVGVAPRGPARPPRFDASWAQLPVAPGRRELPRSIAVAVESMDAYRLLYGDFEGPGRLPYAVAAFFEQGGRRAYVVRVVPAYRDGAPPLEGDGVARATLGGAAPLTTLGGERIVLRARDEGTWGNQLTARLGFRTRSVTFRRISPASIAIRVDESLPAGSLLRFRLPGGVFEFCYVSSQYTGWSADLPEIERVVTLDHGLTAEPDDAEIVEGALEIDDHDGRRERHEGLGLDSEHPRWIARVLYEDSRLLYPMPEWVAGAVALPDARLEAIEVGDFTGGKDAYAALESDDFFDEFGWTSQADGPGAGIHALVSVPDLGSLVVPDLYLPAALPPIDAVVPPPSGRSRFACCEEVEAEPQTPPVVELPGLLLDPELPADLERIIGLQRRVVELAESLGSFVALLDVPPRLRHAQILRWRRTFASRYAAGYHPWLKVARSGDGRDRLISINPAAVGAGIIAQRELQLGIPYGPANVIAAGVVDVDERVSPRRHDELHQNSINVFLRERDGIQLAAGRTLSRETRWRQLSVVRLITMLRRTLEMQMQWSVFENHDASLRADISSQIRGYLRQLYRANCFKGATESEAFFVKCDEELNPPASVDRGRLVAHVGVAPAEPLEFIVLRVAGGDGSLRVEA